MPEVPVQPQETTPVKKSHNGKKISITFLIIIVVTSLIAVAYWHFFIHKGSTNPILNAPVQTTTESAKESTYSAEIEGWKTYTNTSSGYQISYPQDATFTEGDLEGEALLGTFMPPAKINHSVTFILSEEAGVAIISAVGYDDTNYLFDAKRSAEILKSTSTAPMVISEIKIGSYSAYKAKFTSPGSEEVYLIFFNGRKVNSAFSISVGVDSSTVKTTNKMLSTFKFLD